MKSRFGLGAIFAFLILGTIYSAYRLVRGEADAFDRLIIATFSILIILGILGIIVLSLSSLFPKGRIHKFLKKLEDIISEIIENISFGSIPQYLSY